MNLAWRCFGQSTSPALVLLHGFLGSGSDWQDFVSELSNDCFVITIDLPGHGGSTWLERDSEGASFFIERLTSTLLEIERKESIQSAQFSFLGYSLGGRLAIAYALEYPKRVKQLMLEGSHTGLSIELEKQQRTVSDQVWAERFQKVPLDKVLNDWYQQPVFTRLSHGQVASLIASRSGSGERGGTLANAMMAYSLSKQPDYRTEISRSPFPVHYFYGENDQKFGLLAKQLLAEQVINSAHSIAGSGHNIHWEQPAVLASLVRVLLKKS